MTWSPRIELAITTAIEAHGLRRRKAKRGFQTAHVLSVALITADFGFDEDTVVAALLHDTLEDTELDPGIILSRFGAPVLQMVRDVSEPPKPTPWRERKEHLHRADPGHAAAWIARRCVGRQDPQSDEDAC